ncbi:hypothetical protein GCM10023219_22180 [Stakelama sediminis]|uniref:Uncharacterized protein (TIGR00369 family) n=1 Tax=Stakelama sediminis TaxID=463200 RepID=A0A840YZV1_9SPHN|nr:PaaI family thioesterase [Stakelama sediminis]MBB5719173.1 uncharacterized protein (TIGR00369 family) [Stakelama sediminis]
MTLPPYADLLGLHLEPQADDAPPVLMLPFAEAVTGRPNFLHGGAIGGLLEMAAIAALYHALDQAQAQIKPINITIDFMRGGRPKETRAMGIVSRLGSRIANVEAVAWQDDRETPIASARLNCLIKRA